MAPGPRIDAPPLAPSVDPLPLKRVRKPKKKKSNALLIAMIGVTTGVLGCGGIVTLMLAPHIAKRRLDVQRDAETTRSLSDSPDLPEWVADATFVEQLGPEVAVPGFIMRVPAAFTPAYTGRQQPPVISMPGGATGQRWAWVGPRLSSGRHAVIEVEVRSPPKGLDARTHFEREFPVELRVTRNSHKVSEVLAGHVGGKRAIRVTYVMPKGPLDCIDLFYFHSNCQVVVTVACPSADSAEFLPLLQAAQLTVRRADQSPAAPGPRLP